MVEAKDQQDMGDGMQCVNHPFTKNPGGICAFCLQEKLGKLVTSSFPLPKHLSSSSTSSSSPSFRSDSVGSTTTATTVSASLSLSASGARIVTANNNNYNNSTKLPFLLAKKKSSSSTANIVFKRSQSTTTAAYRVSDSTPRKKSGFWSFLHLHSYKQHSSSKKVGNFHDSSKPTTTKHTENALSKTEVVGSSSSSSSSMSKRVNGGGSGNRNGIDVIVEEDGSPNVAAAPPSERKVSRSRSVGCGSRSFSGDFFERITNGFGDCTLRRVESQREGGSNKGKVSSSSNGGGVREMVRCGGIFGGFMIMTSSSSSSSSSSWVSSSSAEQQHHQNNMAHGGRNRGWGWAFASPMRAFGSSSGKRGRTITDSTSKNSAPNLDAIPSLLVVKS
ncbi:PREDICTED: uncharacterized serine-rich protein C215.13-like [Brassica oleracea var. oleracea]|uniref:Uncharacterized protein n=1 Tax=Brassica oleracea var. oleracea TaxID=109376 RepID=A0A0D2ZUN6_BRAOL|nr:PREDICTED: uncharacterized serine-rich protein C215.13-like [Brassica oleracea var. oleracea]